MVSKSSGLLNAVLEMSRNALPKPSPPVLPTIPGSPSPLQRTVRTPLVPSDWDDDTGATSDEARDREGGVERRGFDSRTGHRTVDRAVGRAAVDRALGRTLVDRAVVDRAVVDRAADKAVVRVVDKTKGRFKQLLSNTSSDESDCARNDVTSRRYLRDSTRGKGHVLRRGGHSDAKQSEGVALTTLNTEDRTTGSYPDFVGSMTKTETQDTLLLLSPEISASPTTRLPSSLNNIEDPLPPPPQSSSVGSCHSSADTEPETPTPVSRPLLQNHQRINAVDSLPLPVVTPPQEIVRVRNRTLPRVRRRRTIARKPSMSPTGLLQTGPAGTRSVSVGSVYFENPVFSRADEEATTEGKTFGCVSSKTRSMASMSLKNLLTTEPSNCRSQSPFRASRSGRH